jgi:precorrin-6Y C5,15-methyltransferase (decarboxylating)
MSRPVVIVGVGAEGLLGLSRRVASTVESATFLAGGRRHLERIGPRPATREVFVIANNLRGLADRLRGRAADERCVVLASGDPLFYGIGHFLGQELGSDQLVVEPSLSSIQLGFARAGVSWHDAAIASIHGRPLKEALLPLLGKPKIGLFTQDGSSPSEVASFFLDRGLADYEAIVGEDLGACGEILTRCRLQGLKEKRFGPLNIVILMRDRESLSPGYGIADERGGIIPDDLFARPETPPILLTHADVRAIVAGRFWGIPEGPLWDIGAGLGGVAVGLARAFPAREVAAFERSRTQLAYLHANRRRFGVYNLRIVEGTAPGCLEGEDDPAAVFLGGSGGQLAAILDSVFGRLRPGGTLVANFVALENLGFTLDRLRSAGWPHDVTQVPISRSEDLAGLTALSPLRPVWIVRASPP